MFNYYEELDMDFYEEKLKTDFEILEDLDVFKDLKSLEELDGFDDFMEGFDEFNKNLRKKETR